MKQFTVLWPLFLFLEVVSPLQLGSFNVQVFGQGKLKRPGVTDALVEIISRYDILLMQEIRDSKETAVDILLDQLNANAKSSWYKYKVVVSERLGKTSSKEQYAFYYRPSRVIVEDTYQYEDPKDEFEREPFSVLFKPKSKNIPKFVVIAVHIDPDKVLEEMNSMVKVYDKVHAKFNTENIIISGDMNADCAYLPKKHLPKLKLLTDSKFDWLIKDDADTTTGNTDCAYDRFIATGAELLRRIKNVGVFNYEHELHMNRSMALLVSDHYPIEMEIKALRRSKNKPRKKLPRKNKGKKKPRKNKGKKKPRKNKGKKKPRKSKGKKKPRKNKGRKSRRKNRRKPGRE